MIPLGQLLCELAPGLLVPLGMDVVAAGRARGARARPRPPGGVVTVFTADGTPFQVSEGAFQTARAPGPREARGRRARRRWTTPPTHPPARSVVNDAVGRFALWGFPDAARIASCCLPGEVNGEDPRPRVPDEVRQAPGGRRRAPRRRARSRCPRSSAGTPSSTTRASSRSRSTTGAHAVLSTLVCARRRCCSSATSSPSRPASTTRCSWSIPRADSGRSATASAAGSSTTRSRWSASR